MLNLFFQFQKQNLMKKFKLSFKILGITENIFRNFYL